MCGRMETQSVTMLCGFDLFLYCLPFRCAHFPNMWCLVPEIIIDLANDLISRQEWDESIFVLRIFRN